MAKKTLGKDEAVDVHIAAGLALHALMDDKGMESLGQLLQGAKDHVQALAHGIFMIVSQVRQQLQQKGISIDSRVWIASGGVLDQVIGNLGAVVAGVFGLDDAATPEFAQAVKKAVVQLMQQEDDHQG